VDLDGRHRVGVPRPLGHRPGRHEPGFALSPDERLIIVGIGALGSATYVYSTTDGSAWDGYEVAPPALDGQLLLDATGTPPQLIAVGSSGRVPVAENQFLGMATLWTSADWVTWEQLLVGTPGALEAIAYDSEGERFVAGGRQVDPAGELSGQPAVWLSSDGRTWSPVIIDPRLGLVSDVATTNGVIFAVGHVGDGATSTTVVWESRDGMTWAATALVNDAQASPWVVAHEEQAIVLLSTCCEDAETQIWRATVDP